MRKPFLLTVALFLCFAVVTYSQQPEPSATPAGKEPAKTNSRPTEKRAVAEPFDGADVKKMAEQCVLLDTEAGKIEIELYPEHAPESVRSFLNLVPARPVAGGRQDPALPAPATPAPGAKTSTPI